MGRLAAVEVTLRTHHTAIDGTLRAYAEKKLARLDRLLPRAGSVTVEVAYEETRSAAHRYTVQVTLHAGSSVLRAEERAGDPKVALDVAVDALSRQARRHKQRLYGRHRTHEAKDVAEALANPPGEGESEDEEETEYLLGKVVRVKHFEVKPMSEEEALAQMDLIGHDFFLFLDAATNEYALIYKRKDGDYGLLSPRRV